MPFLQLTFHIARIIRKLYFEEAAVQLHVTDEPRFIGSWNACPDTASFIA
jgi:hypothetical protein